MIERSAVKLALAEQGWIRIDNVTSRVRGEVQRIVEEMQHTLECEEVVSLCGRLGLCSAGFMFLDRFTRMTRFFSTEPVPSPTYKTPYISMSAAISEELFDEIHVLFVHIREKQDGWLDREGALVPEYLRYLSCSDLLLVAEEQELRKKYGIHYCSYGEMIVTTFLWRALTIAQRLGLGEREVEKILPLPFDAPVRRSIDLVWAGEDLMAKVDSFANEKWGRAALLPEAWDRQLGPGPSWRDEWRALQLDSETHKNFELARRAGLRFCQALGVKISGTGSDLDDISDRTINETFSRAFSRLMKALGCADRFGTVDEAKASLEAYARFPIPSFYVWNALEQDAKVYCVVPVWSSQGYPLQHGDQEYNHFGLALTALRPMAEIDWTLPADNHIGFPPPVRTDPLIVSSLLRLMAKPLVEHSLYGSLVKLAEEVGKEGMGSLISAAIDDLTRRRNPRKTPVKGRASKTKTS